MRLAAARNTSTLQPSAFSFLGPANELAEGNVARETVHDDRQERDDCGTPEEEWRVAAQFSATSFHTHRCRSGRSEPDSKTTAAQVARIVGQARRPSVIWLHFQDCTGCTETLLRTSAPDVGHLKYKYAPGEKMSYSCKKPSR